MLVGLNVEELCSIMQRHSEYTSIVLGVFVWDDHVSSVLSTCVYVGFVSVVRVALLDVVVPCEGSGGTVSGNVEGGAGGEFCLGLAGLGFGLSRSLVLFLVCCFSLCVFCCRVVFC